MEYHIFFLKLDLPHGYIYRFKVYSGQENDRDDVSVSTDVVIKLCENVLVAKRALYVDNFCNSVSLAKRFLERKTLLESTLRINRKYNLQTVQKKKLEKGLHQFSKIGQHISVIYHSPGQAVLSISLSPRHTNLMIRLRSL